MLRFVPRWFPIFVLLANLSLTHDTVAQTLPTNSKAPPAGAPKAASQTAETPRPMTPNVAATVNGEVIRLDQVDAMIRRATLAEGPLTTNQTRRLRQEIVQDLIEDVLLRQFLRQHGPKNDPVEVEKHFRALAVSLQRRGKTLAEYYREVGQTEEQIRDTWATMLQFQKYTEQQATEERLKKYFEANRDLFDQVQIRVSRIVIRVSPNAPPGERETARQKLTKIRDDILAGQIRFAEAAQKYSVCPSSQKGGDLGWISRRDSVVDEAFARIAFGIKVNELSEPIPTEYGVELAYVTDRKTGMPATFEKVQDLVRECYAEDVRQNLMTLLRSQATIEISLPDLATSGR